jgi:hypothetical protein
MENTTGSRGESGEDITWAGCILATLNPGTELTIGKEEIEVVASHEILRQTNNSCCQTLFSMMVRSLFRYISYQLGNLSLSPQRSS